jgi:hypothetical protein
LYVRVVVDLLALIIVMILDRRLDYFTWLGREEHFFIIVVDVPAF